jgi:hypothetical protein
MFFLTTFRTSLIWNDPKQMECVERTKNQYNPWLPGPGPSLPDGSWWLKQQNCPVPKGGGLQCVNGKCAADGKDWKEFKA